MKKIKDLYYLLIGIICGILFLISYLIINSNFLISVGVSLAAYIILYLIKYLTRDKNEEKLYKLNKEALQKIKVGKANLKTMKEICSKLKNKDLSQKLYYMFATCDDILEKLETCPTKIYERERFLDYYLVTLLKIINKYYELEQVELKGEEIKETMIKIEENINLIGKDFMKVLDNLYHDELSELDSNMDVLKKSIKDDVIDI